MNLHRFFIRVLKQLPWAGSLTRLLVAGCLCLSVSLIAQLSITPASSDAATASLSDARKLVESSQFEHAARELTLYLNTDSQSAEAHRLLAYSYLRLNDPARSLAEYTTAASIERPRPVDLEDVAKAYVLLKDTKSAEHWVRVALQMDDRDPEGWYDLGRILYTQQHFQEAVDCFQRSLVLLPHGVKAEDNLGLAYEGLNRSDDAAAAYRQAISWQSNSTHPSEQPLLNLSIMLIHQGHYDEALDLLLKAVKIAPGDPRIHEQLGRLYIQTNKLEQAQLELEKAVSLQPTKAALHFLLGKVYHLRGQETKAKSEFALASSLSGQHSTPAEF